MSQIYCLFTCGGSLSDEVSDFLFKKALDLMDSRHRKCRFRLKAIKLTREISTSYKLAFMGSVSGIIFSANVDWEDGSVKTDFIVKPIKNRSEILGGRWGRGTLAAITGRAVDPARN